MFTITQGTLYLCICTVLFIQFIEIYIIILRIIVFNRQRFDRCSKKNIILL